MKSHPVIGKAISVVQPVVSAVQPVVSAVQPVVSAVQPVVSAVQPVVSAVQPVVSAVQPVVSAVQPAISVVQSSDKISHVSLFVQGSKVMGMTNLAYLTGTSYGDMSVEGQCQRREKSFVVLPHPLSLHMTLVIKFQTGGGSEKKPVRCVCVCVCVCVHINKCMIHLSYLHKT